MAARIAVEARRKRKAGSRAQAAIWARRSRCFGRLSSDSYGGDPRRASHVRVIAPAKINLFLHVGERRADGYHALESLIAFVEVSDRISIETASELTFSATGPFSRGLPGGEDNLVLKAARALQRRTGTWKGAAITLKKNLPVAAGIGGGSAD